MNDVIKYAITNELIKYTITNDVIKYAIKNDYAITNDAINKKINNNFVFPNTPAQPTLDDTCLFNFRESTVSHELKDDLQWKMTMDMKNINEIRPVFEDDQ